MDHFTYDPPALKDTVASFLNLCTIRDSQGQPIIVRTLHLNLARCMELEPFVEGVCRATHNPGYDRTKIAKRVQPADRAAAQLVVDSLDYLWDWWDALVHFNNPTLSQSDEDDSEDPELARQQEEARTKLAQLQKQLGDINAHLEPFGESMASLTKTRDDLNAISGRTSEQEGELSVAIQQIASNNEQQQELNRQRDSVKAKIDA